MIREEESDQEARLAEIYENIYVGGLSALDRAIHLATAKKIHETKRGEQRGRKRRDVEFKEEKKVAESAIISSERFTLEAAKRIGLSERAVQEAVQIFERLDPETIAAVRGTMVEGNQNELRQLADLPKSDQIDAARRIGAGEAKNVAQARVAIGLDAPPSDDPQGRIYAQLLDLYARASVVTRKTFMDAVGLVENRAAKKGEAA